MVRRAKSHRRRRGGEKRDAGPAASGLPSDAPADRRWKDGLLLAAIVVFAFSLRLVFVLQSRSSPDFEHPKIDALYHDQWAQAIAAGETFTERPYFRAPFYPAFLGSIYWVFGHSHLAPRVIQALLGSLTCGLLFQLGRTLFGRAVGAVAGFAAAGYWTLIFFDGELLIPSLIVFLDLLLVWFLIRAARAPGILTYGLAGLVMGFSAIARPNILLFGPAIVLWLLVIHRGALARALTYAVCVTAGCLLVVLPITVRNYVVGEDISLIASQGGLNFYMGNNPTSDGRTAALPGASFDALGIEQGSTALAERALGRRLKASEVSDYYYKQAWDFIRQRPGEAVALAVLKFRLFWSRWEIANNKNLYFWTERFAPLIKRLPLGFAVIGPLGILGLVLCWDRRAELFPLWGFVLVYMVSVVLFFCTARYRLPVVPALILLGTYAVFWSVKAVREARWRSVVAGAVVLGFAAVLANVTPHAEAREDDFVSYVMLGNVYDEHGQPDLAVPEYRRALAIAPGDLAACYGLGSALSKLNRLPEGIESFRRVLNGPRVPRAGETVAMLASVHGYLANGLAQAQAYPEAVEHYRAAIELDPQVGQGSDQYNLGLVLGALGQSEVAIVAFVQAIEIKPDFLEAHQQLADALLRQRQFDLAVEHFRTALCLDSANARLYHGLGEALFMQGKYHESLEPLRQCLRLEPNNRGAQARLSQALNRVGVSDEAAEEAVPER